MADKSFTEHIRTRLAPLNPIHLVINDDSAKHAGHAGTHEGGESHFSIKIASAAFEGLSLPTRHRLIYVALAEEMKGKIHALAIEALTLEEYNQKYS